jgi:neutral ceramidase
MTAPPIPRLRTFALLLPLLAAFLLALPAPLRAGLRAGTDVTDITPLPGHFPVSTAGSMRSSSLPGTEERIHCRTLVLGDEGTLLSFTLVDSCLIPRGLLDEAKRKASELTGIPAGHLNVAATHTHSAPAAAPAFQSNPTLDYQIFLAERIANSIAAAHAKLEPCEIGWAVGEDATQVFNRRWHVSEPYKNPFGSMDDQVRMNPGYNKGNGAVTRPAGPVDPAVPLLAVRSAAEGKRPLAVLANYALHYVGNPPRTPEGAAQLSGDYFDRFSRIFAEMAAPGREDFVAILSNGASGDINNIDFSGPAPERSYAPGEKMELVARSVAKAAHEAYGRVEYRAELPVATVARDLDLGVRKPSQEEVDRALEILTSPQQFLDGNYTAAEAIYARETLQIREYPDTVPVRLQAARIGDLCVLTTPCETFVEIGLELKEASPFGTTFLIELANGYNGYLPTPQQHAWGGYETWRAKSSYLETEASTKIVAAFREMMAELEAAP